MSEIEFVLIGLGILLSLAIAKLLEALFYGLTIGTSYWVQTTWALQRLLAAFTYFWTFRGALDSALQMSVYDFFAVLVSPALMFMQSLALLSPSPHNVRDWEDQFLAARRQFFLLHALIMLGNAHAVLVLNSGIPYYGFATQFLAGVVGFNTNDRRTHAALAVLCLVVFALGVAIPVVSVAAG